MAEELDQDDLDLLAAVMPVCGLCRAPVGIGMKVMLFHPDHYRQYLTEQKLEVALKQERATRDDDDPPVIVCLPCGEKIVATGVGRKPS